MDVTSYHNPRCTKSRQTLSLLESRGIAPRVVEYLKTPPSVAELGDILQLLGIPPRQLLRKKEAAYKDAGLDDESLSDAQVIEAIHRQPVLMERPVVMANGKAAIGRPPEAVLEILP